MKLAEAFRVITRIEAKYASTNISFRSINLWPLIRQSLWYELISVSHPPRRKVYIYDLLTLFKKRLVRYAFALSIYLRELNSVASTESVAFISRPVYLQSLPDGFWFDRIVDPLLHLMNPDTLCRKYYLSQSILEFNLSSPATLLGCLPTLNRFPLDQYYYFLESIASDAGVDSSNFISRVRQSVASFDRWYQFGNKFFDLRSQLKLIFVTSWYFPDLMGLIAAAHERGVKVVDVQHGKQGKLQAMYSGWNIPKGGYEMMPDFFWCWGQPSVNHILQTSPKRDCHNPFIGGYPWIEYYQKYIFSPSMKTLDPCKKYILITLQPPQGANSEPIPDFILHFMSKCPNNVHFIFRVHPNHSNGVSYCHHRLAAFSKDIFDIDDSSTNLYDTFMLATHHITAYSSCCYEADVFNIPTLLFGVDALTIYKDEIKNGIFSWTIGALVDLECWFEQSCRDLSPSSCPYVISSLNHARSVLACLESGDTCDVLSSF